MYHRLGILVRVLRERWPAWVLLAVALVATGCVWRTTQEQVRSRDRARFERQVERTRSAIQERLRACEHSLLATRGLFAASKSVERDEWRACADGLLAGANESSISGLGFIAYVSSDRLPGYLTEIRADGAPDFAITPEGRRGDYLVLQYLYPSLHSVAIGADMGVHPTLRAVADQAAETGSQVFVRGNREALGTDTLLAMLPFYANGQPAGTVADRRSSIAGWVCAIVSISDLMHGSLAEAMNTGIDVEVFSGPQMSQATLLYDNDDNQTAEEEEWEATFTTTVGIDVGEEKWTLYLKTLPAFDAGSNRTAPRLVLVSGLAASVMLFLMLWSWRTTHRALAEATCVNARLGEGEARYRTLFESSAEGVFLLGDVFLDCNDQACRIWACEREDIIGRTLADFSPETQPDGMGSVEAARERLEAAFAGEPQFFYWQHVRKDGVLTDVEVTLKALTVGGERVLQVTMRDVTERRQAEEERERLVALLRGSNEDLEGLNRQLAVSNRELEDFAYVASHDLQEPLRKVQAFGDRLHAKCGEAFDDQGRDYLDRMQNAAGRMKTLINDLLSYSRVTTKAQPLVPVDLDQVTREVLSDLEVRIEGSGARVEVAGLPTIEADHVQMRQLLQNLIGNALKFHREGEAPEIKVHAEVREEQSETSGQSASRCKSCYVTVEDNGIGFDAKYTDRIFGVFQRLHGRGEYDGTGVGLAVCRKIVEHHGGDIQAESTAGKGARFVVRLPVAQPKGEMVQ